MNWLIVILVFLLVAVPLAFIVKGRDTWSDTIRKIWQGF